MTKKTNALMLRYGLSVLWQNKCLNTKTISNTIQLENIIYKNLLNKNLKILTIKYHSKFVNIFVYNFCQYFNISLYQQVLKYYRQVLDLYKVIQVFGVSAKHVLWFFKSVGIIKINLTSWNIIKNTKKSFYKNKRVLQFFYTLLKFFNLVKYNKSVVYLKSIVCLDSFYTYSKKKGNKKLFVRFKKLRKVSGLITFKLFSIKLENSIFWAYNTFIHISITNVFFFKGFRVNYRVNNNLLKAKKNDLRFLLYTFLLAVRYCSSKIIVDYLLNLIKKNKNHHRSLKIFTNFLEKLFLYKAIKLLGFQLRVTGKLGGKMRKSKYHYKLGKVQLQTLKSRLSYDLGLSYTKFGIISIKVWLLHANY